MATAVATLTTVHIDWTSAPTIRMQANVDMPEYGLKAEQVFYLVRASANDGTYYIVTWSYGQIAWQCPCKHSVERPNARPCRHKNAVSAYCKARKIARENNAAELKRQVDTYLAKMQKQAIIREQAHKGATSIEQRLACAGLMARR